VAVGSLEGPLAVGEGLVLLGVVGALDDVSAAGHVEVAVLGAVDLVRGVAAVVLLVALEGGVDALPVRTVERTWEWMTALKSPRVLGGET
jgi:hypothetical protein